MNEKLYKLKEEFLNEWPIIRLEKMTLEEYTDTNRDNSFCYWLEHKTRTLGSIVGGSSYKFGVYKMNTTSKTESATNRDNDEAYAWHTKYGSTSQEAFDTVKSLIIEIVKLTTSNNLNAIESIDLGDAYKWKIAFLYSNFAVVNIFKKEALRFVANSKFNVETVPEAYGDLNDFILSKQREQDYFSFTKELWQHYDKYNSKAVEFKKWLDKVNTEKSNKSSSYISAIKILTTVFNIEVYTETNIIVLEELYEDLILNQKDLNGKYAYEKKSYGTKGFYSAAIKAYIEFLSTELNLIASEPENGYNTINKKTPMSFPLNQILYGPPGTGKTYNTINKSVAIANPEFDISVDRELLKEEYGRLVKEGQIVFTTFHQSMAYEDFVEGIKPQSEDGDVTYDIEDGLFKKIAIESLTIPKIEAGDNIDFTNCNFYKMSLGGKHRKEIHDWCLNNNYIALGWGGDKDLNIITNPNFKEGFYELNPDLIDESKYHASSSMIFKNNMKVGDVVFATLGNLIVDAVGVLVDEYEYKNSNAIHFKHYRKVKWLAKGLNSSPKLFLDKKISQASIYQFNSEDVNVDKLTTMFNKSVISNNNLNRVLIIDEINRGNVSAIFGELITLIEESKRLGNKEALEVTLPYSKEKFGVPNNLHIIGTMNTADRSVEALDTALRRRFVFKEMMPDSELLEGKIVGGIYLKDILETINSRIEVLIDRDHTIGHSYFMNINSKEDLANTFKNNIVPLLQEYFYGDYGKIGLVLGEGFVESVKQHTNKLFADFKDVDDVEDFNTKVFRLKKIEASNVVDAVDVLLNNKKKNTITNTQETTSVE